MILTLCRAIISFKHICERELVNIFASHAIIILRNPIITECPIFVALWQTNLRFRSNISHSWAMIDINLEKVIRSITLINNSLVNMNISKDSYVWKCAKLT